MGLGEREIRFPPKKKERENSSTVQTPGGWKGEGRRAGLEKKQPPRSGDILHGEGGRGKTDRERELIELYRYSRWGGSERESAPFILSHSTILIPKLGERGGE